MAEVTGMEIRGSELGRVIDPDELERAEGPVGRLTIDVLEDWLAEGAEVEVVVPSLVSCARCDGGGCDQCGRSGAFRLELDEAARTLTITLPCVTEKKAIAIRLVRPLGEEAPLEQLWIELRAGERASAFVRKLPRAPSGHRGAILKSSTTILLLVAIAILLAVLLTRHPP